MHKHLTWTDRLKIEKALKQGLKPLQIADRLHVCNTTIYRELKRGEYMHLNSDLTTEKRYSPEIAQQKYDEQLKAKGGDLKIGDDHELAAFIEKKIADEGYSPAAVVGEIKRLGLTFRTEISEKTIYNYIDKGVFLRLERADLPQKGKRKRKYDKVKSKPARAPKGESIENRPQEINDRETFGHWEMDCVEGKKKTKEALLVLSERLTRQEIIIKMPDKTAASVVKALNRLERKYGRRFPQVFKSITVDNGSEFADCAGIEKSIFGRGKRKRTTVYYCHPYSAYERGTNENTNKMIRRFLPKGTDFRQVSVEYVARVEAWINNYPREILGFETSGALFERYLAEAA